MASPTQDLDLNEFDFVDFGCSTGHSLAWACKHLGGKRGLGIDADPAKVATARLHGRDAITARVQELDLPKGAFSFVSMIHFLEHLPDYKAAHTAMATAARLSKDFVYIRHPWFDSDYTLMKMGYKLFWSDWTGHPNKFGALEFVRALQGEARATDWCIFGRGQINDTTDPSLLPLGAPKNSQSAELREALQRRRNSIDGVYSEVGCLIQIKGSRRFDKIKAHLRDHDWLFSKADAAVT